MVKKSILFVRGFATALSTGTDDYIYIKVLLEQNYDFSYFDYELSEPINDVYDRMYKNIIEIEPHILIGHSLGGALVTKYIKSNPNAPEKIILLMPLLFKNMKGDIADLFFNTQLTFNPKLIYPHGLLIPSENIFEGGNLLNSNFSLISYRQVFDLYRDKNVVTTNDVSFIKENKQITIFYASQELLNTIDESILKNIPASQLIRVSGLHEPWRSIKITNFDFFSKLMEVLKRD
jgi:hypothetical protein